MEIKRGRQLEKPLAEETLHLTRAESVTDLLQGVRILTFSESVIQGPVADPGLMQLTLGPFVPVEPKPDGVRSIGIGLPESFPPLAVPKIEVEMVDESHLSSPLHVGMGCPLLSLGFPRSPGRGLFLRDSDQSDPVLTLFGSRFQIGFGHGFFLLPLLEADHWDGPLLGKLVNLLDIALPDLTKSGRGGNLVPLVPTQVLADLSHRLELRYVSL